jgi:hypothetical protein
MVSQASERARAGFHDAMQAADRLPVLVVSCWGAMAVVSQVAPSLIGALLGQGLALASLLVGAHRLWLLGEVQDRPVWQLPRQYLDVALWLLGVILSFAPALWVGQSDVPLAMMLAAIAGVLSLGTMTLLPGLAVEDSGAGYVACFRQMMPHAVIALLALLIAALPGLVVLYAQTQIPKAAAILDPTARLLLALPLAAVSARMHALGSG